MTAQLIDGKGTAATIHEEIKAEVEELKAKHNVTPGLATVLVGENPASQFYVRSKQKRCAEVGIQSFGNTLPEDASQEEVDGLVAELNANPDVHGILVQLPLPKHLNEEQVLSAVGLDKDVDGFHPINIGRLSMKGREPMFVPCTPSGCIELLDRYGIDIEGKEAVVLGRSNIVGLPVAMLLLHRNASITICHSRTKDLPGTCRRADILSARRCEDGGGGGKRLHRGNGSACPNAPEAARHPRRCARDRDRGDPKRQQQTVGGGGACRTYRQGGSGGKGYRCEPGWCPVGSRYVTMSAHQGRVIESAGQASDGSRDQEGARHSKAQVGHPVSPPQVRSSPAA